MSEIRKVKKIVKGRSTIDGAGVKLVRVLGHGDMDLFDPFLLLDGFGSENPEDYMKGFPWHPHRGIETVTYMVSGRVAHGDSLGNTGVIGPGDCQWMTAGSGIIHQEMPEESGHLSGVQLWVNMSAKEKMSPPKYRDIIASDIPSVALENGGEVKILSGTYKGVSGVILPDYVQVTYLDVHLLVDEDWSYEVKSGDTVFLYTISGQGTFGPDDEQIGERCAILLDSGDTVKATGGAYGTRFLLIAGTPLNEPIAWGGPIVMNTKSELDLAFREINEGNFIK